MENNVFSLDMESYEPITAVEAFIYNESVLSSIGEKIKTAYKKAVEFIKKLLLKIKNFFIMLKNKIMAFVKKIIGKVKQKEEKQTANVDAPITVTVDCYEFNNKIVTFIIDTLLDIYKKVEKTHDFGSTVLPDDVEWICTTKWVNQRLQDDTPGADPRSMLLIKTQKTLKFDKNNPVSNFLQLQFLHFSNNLDKFKDRLYKVVYNVENLISRYCDKLQDSAKGHLDSIRAFTLNDTINKLVSSISTITKGVTGNILSSQHEYQHKMLRIVGEVIRKKQGIETK